MTIDQAKLAKQANDNAFMDMIGDEASALATALAVAIGEGKTADDPIKRMQRGVALAATVHDRILAEIESQSGMDSPCDTKTAR